MNEIGQALGSPNTVAPPAGLRQFLSIPGFAVRIDGYEVPDAARLNAALLDAIALWRAEDPGIVSSNKLGGWHSRRDLFRRQEPAFRTLLGHVQDGLTQSIRRYWADYAPGEHPVASEGWVNVNGPGAFNAPHAHDASHLSGVYYIRAPDHPSRQSGAIEFLNPAGAMNTVLPFGKRMVHDSMRIVPREGQMLIFPSYLRHWVYPNQDGEDRVSVAFNVQVTADVVR